MRHGSLFSGIGGFDLAAQWMGWENVFHCEWNPFGQKVLKHYWPKAESFNDITQSDFTKYANKIDILTGGFPCQPYSSAGKRKGKEDERHLWPEMLRAIREIKPKYIVGENVFGLLNWNGGMVFDEVHSDLEFEGYEVQAVVIPAAAVNAPHGRDRVWFVATNTKYLRCEQCQQQRQSRCQKGVFKGVCDNGINTNTNGNGFNERNGNDEINPSEGWDYAFGDIEQIFTDSKCIGRTEIRNDNGQFEKTQQAKCGEQQFSGTDSTQNWWRDFPSQSPICGGDDGIPTKLDGITFSKWRQESIKGYGNAIVPQVAFEIFKAIEKCDEVLL